MSAKKELAQKVTAIIIIIIMTFADFAIVGINAISYAIDMKITNSNNVEFCAYFVDDNKQQVTEINSNINANDLKVYIEISVKNEGYFNGKISLENSSFRFNNKNTNENEFVKEIDESNITLNQINAGNTAEIEVGIEFLNEDNIEFDSLGKDNKINLTGVYKNSKKDIDIQGNTTVKINWNSQEGLNAKIGAKILTNKAYEIEGSQKRIVQVLVDSKLENDLYPIKNTNIRLNVPQGVEKVKVHSRSTDATNGKSEFDEENYRYNSETGVLEINIQNEEKDGKISWLKNRKDSLVVTYIYPENMDLEKQEINIESLITTYDERQVNANCKTVIEGDINGVLTSSINLDETEIYKGKLYTAEERYYTTSTIIDVNYTLMDKVQIEEKQAVFCVNDEIKQANIQYVQSKINKAEFEKILGQDGYITILDQDGNTIANINKDTDADDNGYININYNSGVKSITINTSKPLTEKTLNIYHRKVILDSKYSKEEISEFTGIKEEISNGYNANNVRTIELKNTESKASIEVSTDTLSVIKENKNVEIVATLENNDESKDLYKNPSVDIIFPREITQVKILSAKALYRNGLTVAKCEKIKNQYGNTVLHIDFEGEQEKYNSEILKGLEIHIYADLTLDKTLPNKTTAFIMNYSNDNGNKDLYSVSKIINVESQNGLVLYNSISDFNKQDEKIEIIDEKQTTAKLDMNSKEKTAKVETALINNYDENITEDTVVIGKIPVKNNENTFSTEISNLTVSNKNAQIFYSKDINAKADDKSWSTKSTDAKSYKVVLDNVDSGEVVNISYQISIPKNLTYNQEGVLGTTVMYNYEEDKIETTSNIILQTEKIDISKVSKGNTINTDSNLEINMIATSGNRELTQAEEIYEGETIKYTVNITNNSDENYENIELIATHTNGIIFDLVETEVFNSVIYDGDGYGIENYWKETGSNIKKFTGIKLSSKQKITLEYQVVVYKNSGENTYGNISIKSPDNKLNEEVETIKNKVNESQVKLRFVPAVSEECVWYSESVQQVNLEVINMTAENIENIEIKITLSKEVSCDKFEDYIDWPKDINVEIVNKEKNALGETIITVKIINLLANQTANIYVKPYLSMFEGEEINSEFYATATANNITYTSNKITRKFLQSRKQVEMTSSAKIEDKIVDKDTKANNGDKIEFYITVKNLEKEKTSYYILTAIQEGLDVQNIILKRKDKEEDITDKYKNRYLSYILTLDKDEEVNIVITTKLDTLYLNGKDSIINKVNVEDIDTGVVYKTSTIEFGVNVPKVDDRKLNVEAKQEANYKDKSTVKTGDKVQYSLTLSNICDFDRTIGIQDYINSAIEDVTVKMDDKDITKDCVSDNNLIIENYLLKANTTKNIVITGKINLENYTAKTILNSFIIKSSLGDIESNVITYYTSEQIGDEDILSYTVKGKAWKDSNKNGKRDEDEELIPDIEVKAIDTKTKKVQDTSIFTDQNGNYELTLKEGQYIIIFIYNNEDYYITTYQANNVNDSLNSDAVSKNMDINDKNMTVGATDVINLSSNKNNIDIGLVLREKFDLKLEKYVTNITVSNKKGIKSYDFNDSNLAKIEIPAKYLESSTVNVEYKIKVTNVGDIEGYAQNIVDYMPEGFTFNESLNKGWHQSDNYLYNESISSEKIGKGDNIEVKLILTKKMSESNTGLVNNTAKIESYNNLKELEDSSLDNNKGSADVIISIKTGEVIRFMLLILSFIIAIGGTIYCVMKRYSYRNI